MLPERKPLAILCILAVMALLYATMYPFNPHPRNDVSWLSDANGIRFEHSGIVFSDGALQPLPGSDAGDECAIEIYLRGVPRYDTGIILTFSSDDRPDAVFFRQWEQSLLVDRPIPSRWHVPRLDHSEVDDVLPPGQLVFITVSSGPHGTNYYFDGKFAKNDPRFRIHRNELYGQIVLGTTASNYEVWQGEIRGLAIYDDQVSAAQAAAHYAAWSEDAPPPRAEDASHLLARYDFRERSGTLIHSEIASAQPLVIPRHFSIPRKPRLNSLGHEFEWTAEYRSHVVENILGFMPFGFVLCGLFALSRSRWQAIVIATFCGGFLSYSIEFLQYYIPPRESDWTDVVANTIGMLLGALIARPEIVRGALRLVHLIQPNRNSEASGN